MNTRNVDWRRGIVGVTLATACFAALDSCTKLVGTLAPLLLVVWARYLVMTAMVAPAQWLRRGRAAWQTRHFGLQVVRGLSLLLCSVFAFLSLRHMPVGEFTAVVMLTPLVITAAAGRALGEQVPLLRWLCVLGGFAGAMLVIRPDGSDFNWALLFPLGLVATNAAYQVLTGKLAKLGEDAGTLQLYTGAVGLLCTSVPLAFSWQTPSGWHVWGLLVLVGVLGMLGHQFLIHAYQHVPASGLTPFLYLQIGFGMLMGWLMFGQVPDAWALAGVGLIALCGVMGTAGASRAVT